MVVQSVHEDGKLIIRMTLAEWCGEDILTIFLPRPVREPKRIVSGKLSDDPFEVGRLTRREESYPLFAYRLSPCHTAIASVSTRSACVPSH